MTKNTTTSQESSLKTPADAPSSAATPFLWVGAGLLFVGLLFARLIYPELLWLTIAIALILVSILGVLVVQNQKALRSRSAAYGLNSAITVILMVAIVGVLNFVASRYPFNLDLTKNKKHTLSDQTVKLVKELQKTIKATVFTDQKEKFRPLMDNYKALNPKFEVEYVSPTRELSRVKLSGIKKLDTLVLAVGAKEDRVEDITEEKLTNALIRLLKEKSPILCVATGHGEKSLSGTDSEGYESVKKALTAQYYEVKEISILQETKVPDTCDAIAILGPKKAYFEPEAKALKTYLDNGGRAIVALDINDKGSEFNPEIVSLLEQWHIKPVFALIVDPISRMFGADASVAISRATDISRESPITKDFHADCIFPFARPLELVPGAPAGLKVEWVSQTTPNALSVTDLSQLKKGEVHFNPEKDKKGPLNLVMSAEGKQKDSKATRNTRLVVLGTSNMGTNQFTRMGGNLDLFVNSVSWIMEDENLISIRAKEETSGKIEMSSKVGSFIFLTTIVVLPLFIVALGISIWVYRRKL